MSSLLNTLVRGFSILRSNSRLVFIGVLIFVFPIFYITVFHSFIEVAKTNTETVEKRRVAMLHDTAVLLLDTYPSNQPQMQKFITSLKNESPDITEVRLVKKTNEGYLILESFSESKIGSYESVIDMFSVAAAATESSFIFEFNTKEGRAWQAVRRVDVANEQYYIISEHSFATIDQVFSSREQRAYLGLTAIFAFLIALAYWQGRQIDWHRKYDKAVTQLHERDLFTNMIAHEFRTPLTAIKGYSSFLSDSNSLSDKEKTFVAAILTSGDRLLALVNDFLEVARLQSGKFNIEKKETDIQPTILAVVEALKSQAEQKGLTLSFKPLGVPVVIKTDADRLYQILQNLVSNSIKYTKTGRVEITTESTPLSVVIKIKDTGMGISAEDQQKLFTPFSRVGGVDKTTITGTGLGMWITRQMIELLNGTVFVESIKDVGTHVVVTLKR